MWMSLNTIPIYTVSRPRLLFAEKQLYFPSVPCSELEIHPLNLAKQYLDCPSFSLTFHFLYIISHLQVIGVVQRLHISFTQIPQILAFSLVFSLFPSYVFNIPDDIQYII